MDKILWDEGIEENFNALIEKTPVFLRGVAQEKVRGRIQSLLMEQGVSSVTQKILVDAFLKETPFGFHGLLKKDMKEMNIDYTRYGYKE